MNFHFFARLKELSASVKKYRTLRDSLKDILRPIDPKKMKKSIFKMSSDEFYDYVTDPNQESKDYADMYFKFLFDYVLTGYLNGDLNDIDLKKILGLENPLQINRYVDKLVRSTKMQGSLLDELMRYENMPEKENELYSMILPDYAYDREKKKVKIKNFDDFKKAIGESADELQRQKKLLALAKMKLQEKQRWEEYRKAILINSPEVAELISKDVFLSEDKEIEHDTDILRKEIEKQKKGTIIRKAPSGEKHAVLNKEISEMSPGELIEFKKKLLNKLRKDIGKTGEGFGGTSTKV